jgi:Cu/Ag efflux pump CusA
VRAKSSRESPSSAMARTPSQSSHKNPINRFLIWVYRPVTRGVLEANVLTIVIAVYCLPAVSGRSPRTPELFSPA